jgi:hypothetical protein
MEVRFMAGQMIKKQLETLLRCRVGQLSVVIRKLPMKLTDLIKRITDLG